MNHLTILFHIQQGWEFKGIWVTKCEMGKFWENIQNIFFFVYMFLNPQ